MVDPTQPGIQASTVIRNIGQLVTISQQPVPGASGPLQVMANAVSRFTMVILSGLVQMMMLNRCSSKIRVVGMGFNH